MNHNIRKKIVVLFIIFWVILALVLIIFTIYNNSANKYGDYVEISNISNYIKYKPQDKNTMDFIKHNLLETIRLNTQNKTQPNSVKDIIVRDNSFQQNYDQTIDIYTVKFIVDIPSLSQSYLVNYQWSNKEDNIHINENGTMVVCLPPQQLIYKEFNCKDSFSIQKGNVDPMVEFLPYSTFNYTVTATMKDNDKVDLDVNMILYSSDTRDGNRDNAIAKYKTEIIDWIKSIKLNPDDYLINYSING